VGKNFGKLAAIMPWASSGRGSMDVLVEIGSAPDDDYPNRQHETDCKGCEHFQFPPCRIFCLRLVVILRQAGRADHPDRNPLGTASRDEGDRAGREF
jgi:hypothetical protein